MGEQQFPNFLVKRVFLTPDRPALFFNGKQQTFLELYNRSYQVAGQLTNNDVKKNDCIAVLLKNHEDTIYILLALQLIGATSVIINSRLTAEEIVWQLNDSKSKLLITEEAFNETIEKINEFDSEKNILTKENLFSLNFQEPIICEVAQQNDICSVMYTSGTTGHPKGVLQTYGNHWWSAIGSALNLGLAEHDSWLCAVPLFHISGYSILMRSIIYGMEMHLHESFDEDQAIEQIKAGNVTIMSVVSTMMTRILELLGEDKFPDSFRCMLLGGGPASLPLLEKCVEKNIPIFQTYGMTETSSQIVTLAPEYSIKKLGSAGKSLFPSQLKIVNSEGELANPNEAGEIKVKGPNITIGYLNRPEETSKKIENGWLATGDIGYLDEDGFLYVLDRRSDLIISGGENIYPAEIEGVLTSHPEIKDAGVIGVEDRHWGQIPIAFLSTKSDLNEEEIIHFCRQKLAKYKIPKKIIFMDEIPRNAAKKLLRRKLRDML